MSDATPVCPECGGPMHLESTAYGRAWVCARGTSITNRCNGRIPLAEDQALTELQLADEIARDLWGNAKESANQQAKYRRMATPLRELAKSKLLSVAERWTLSEGAAIIERLANAAELAKDRAKRQQKLKEVQRQDRYRKAMGLLGPSLAPDPSRLEASVVTLLALARFSEQDRFLSYERVEDVEAALRREIMGEQTIVDALFRDLVSGHETLRQSLARDWSDSTVPIEDLHAKLTEALPGLRDAILAAPPAYLQAVRLLLAEDTSGNVVRLSSRRFP